jgi:hypothetical protein
MKRVARKCKKRERNKNPHGIEHIACSRTDIWIGKQLHAGRQIENRQADMQTNLGWRADRQKGRQTYLSRQIGRQANRQAGRQEGRQGGRHTWAGRRRAV